MIYEVYLVDKSIIKYEIDEVEEQLEFEKQIKSKDKIICYGGMVIFKTSILFIKLVG